jgi:hypothetical protein
MATIATPCGFSRGMFAGLKHLFSGLGHGVTVLAAGRSTHLLVADYAVEMIGPFQSWFINMIEQGAVQLAQVIFCEAITAVALSAGDGVGLAAVGMTADTVGVGDLASGSVMMTLFTGRY